MSPIFSIVLCTYNAQAYIEECIQSLLNQTLADFELIVVDDGSRDATLSYLSMQSDPRIRVIFLEKNHGLIFARNRGFDESRGQYIAIMDADDIAHPTRLEEQYQVLERGEVDVCGTFHISLNSKNGKRRSRRSATSDSDIRALLTIYCPICNPSTSVRAKVLQQNRYNTANAHAEDYGLWCDIAVNGGRFFNIKKALLTYRLHPGQISVVKKEVAHTSFKSIQSGYVRAITGQDVVPESMPRERRWTQGIAFMRTINSKVPRISFRANCELYAEFQYRRNGWLTIFTRLERVAVALWATAQGHQSAN
ncbi:glycosyltransferase family 2 protein [Rhodoferax sp.]|uniref:glycosyltransferase family 2 protein n=1 Tax=Rhodoferax sp. TaxID=50421 RepID=UPI0025DE8D93|nr:glycosyltransferase family 2 protein [Rhodoferax sp.]